MNSLHKQHIQLARAGGQCLAQADAGSSADTQPRFCLWLILLSSMETFTKQRSECDDVWQNLDRNDERFSPENLSRRSIQIISHILRISRDMLLLWISENIHASMPVLQLPKPCSPQHTDWKCRYTIALGTWLYISDREVFVFLLVISVFTTYNLIPLSWGGRDN